MQLRNVCQCILGPLLFQDRADRHRQDSICAIDLFRFWVLSMCSPMVPVVFSFVPPQDEHFSGTKKLAGAHPNRPKLTGLSFPTLHNSATGTTHVVASKCSWHNFISDQCKTVQLFRLLYFRIVSLCDFTLMPATVKVLETFTEAILLKPFQLFRCIRNDFSSITKKPVLHCWFQSKEQVRISWCQARILWGMLKCCLIFLC